MDDRLYQVEQQKQQALNQSNSLYQGLLDDNQNLYNQQNEYATKQETIQNDILDKQLANQRTEIEKQKNIASQNYQSESKRAKNDYTAFLNPYGVQAERQASSGLNNSGYSETTKLGGFNTYQNRLANANKAMQDAFTQYDSDLNDAILNNDVQKAQNALNRLQMQLEYSQNFYNNKSTISQNQLSNNQSLDSEYYNRYQTEYGNIQNEKAQAEAIRQWEAEMAEQQRQYDANLAYQREQDAYQREIDARNYAYQQEQARIAQEQWEREYALSLANSKKKSSSGGGSSSKSINLSDNLYEGNSSLAKAVMTPTLSTKNYDWYNKNFSSSMSIDDLNEVIAQGLSEGKIKEKDVDKIYKAYQLK